MYDAIKSAKWDGSLAIPALGVSFESVIVKVAVVIRLDAGAHGIYAVGNAKFDSFDCRDDGVSNSLGVFSGERAWRGGG